MEKLGVRLKRKESNHVGTIVYSVQKSQPARDCKGIELHGEMKAFI